MAAWDSKDPRWLVTDRKDGANVNGWHWEEKNLMPWCRERLETLLAGLPAGLDPLLGHAKISGVRDMTGEAVLTRRKGNKTFAYFDLSVTLTWEGRWLETNESITGTVTVSELAVSSEADDLQWAFTADGTGVAQDNLKAAVSGLKPQLQQRLSQFTEQISQVSS